MASRRARRSARGDIEMAPSEVEREDDGEGADQDVAEDSEGELEARRQPVVGDGADGRQDELPRQRGEERARDECGPFAGPPPEVRQGQYEGGGIDDGLRGEEGRAGGGEAGGGKRGRRRGTPTGTRTTASARGGIGIAQPASAPATNEVATPRRQAADAPGATRSRIAPRLRRYRLPSQLFSWCGSPSFSSTLAL